MKKQPQRKLLLNRETLVPLQRDQLAGAVGGRLTPPPTTSRDGGCAPTDPALTCMY